MVTNADPNDLLEEYNYWVDVFGNQLQRSPQQKITTIMVENDPEMIKKFSEIPQYYCKSSKDTLLLHAYYSEQFSEILQYQAILHLISPGIYE